MILGTYGDKNVISKNNFALSRESIEIIPPLSRCTIGSLSNDNGDGNENAPPPGGGGYFLLVG